MKVSKSPAENFDYAMNFASQMETEETIASVVTTSRNRYTQADTTAKIIDASAGHEPAGSSTFAVFWLTGGLVGQRHDVEVKATTSGGRTLEGFLLLSIVKGP